MNRNDKQSSSAPQQSSPLNLNLNRGNTPSINKQRFHNRLPSEQYLETDIDDLLEDDLLEDDLLEDDLLEDSKSTYDNVVPLNVGVEDSKYSRDDSGYSSSVVNDTESNRYSSSDSSSSGGTSSSDYSSSSDSSSSGGCCD